MTGAGVTGDGCVTVQCESSALCRPRAVLFDMDGTLLDSEGIWFQAEKEEFAELGLEWSIERQNIMIGMPIVSGVQAVFDRYGIDANPAEVGPRISARVLDTVKRDGVVWRPGARELLARLDMWGVPMALVTSSMKDYAQLVAALAPGDGFSALVTGDMVVHGKPNPEPYEMAAKALNVPASACVAFEDAETGVMAAYRSGAITVAVPFQTPIPDLPGLTVIDSLECVDDMFFDRIMSKS